MYVYVCVYVCMYMYVCMYVCMHIYSYMFRPFLSIFMWSLAKNILKYVGVNKSEFLMNYTYICIVPVILLNFIILCEHILFSNVYWPMA